MKPNNPATSLEEAYYVIIANFRAQSQEQYNAGYALKQNIAYLNGSGLPKEDLDELLVIDETNNRSRNSKNLNLLIDGVAPKRNNNPDLETAKLLNSSWYSDDRFLKRDQDDINQSMSSKVFPLERGGQYTADVRGNGLCFVNAAIVSIFYDIKTKEALQKFANDIETKFLGKGEENLSLITSLREIRKAASENTTNPQFTGQEAFDLINKVGVTLADGLCKKTVEDYSKTFTESFSESAKSAYNVPKTTMDVIIQKLSKEGFSLNNERGFSLNNETDGCEFDINTIDSDTREIFLETLKTLETLIKAKIRGTNPDTLPNEITSTINQDVFRSLGYDALSCEKSGADVFINNQKPGLTPLRLLTRGGHYFPVIKTENIEGRLLEFNPKIIFENQPIISRSQFNPEKTYELTAQNPASDFTYGDMFIPTDDYSIEGVNVLRSFIKADGGGADSFDSNPSEDFGLNHIPVQLQHLERSTLPPLPPHHVLKAAGGRKEQRLKSRISGSQNFNPSENYPQDELPTHDDIFDSVANPHGGFIKAAGGGADSFNPNPTLEQIMNNIKTTKDGEEDKTKILNLIIVSSLNYDQRFSLLRFSTDSSVTNSYTDRISGLIDEIDSFDPNSILEGIKPNFAENEEKLNLAVVSSLTDSQRYLLLQSSYKTNSYTNEIAGLIDECEKEEKKPPMTKQVIKLLEELALPPLPPTLSIGSSNPMTADIIEKPRRVNVPDLIEAAGDGSGKLINSNRDESDLFNAKSIIKEMIDNFNHDLIEPNRKIILSLRRDDKVDQRDYLYKYSYNNTITNSYSERILGLILECNEEEEKEKLPMVPQTSQQLERAALPPTPPPTLPSGRITSDVSPATTTILRNEERRSDAVVPVAPKGGCCNIS